MKYLFFINPNAGKGKNQKSIISDINEYFRNNGGDYEIIETRFKGDAEQTVREYVNTGEQLRVFACGGEGTAYEVANGIHGFDNAEMGVIPCGSANDFLKYFEAREPFRDIKSQIEGEATPIDLITADDRVCINGCSVGMDAMVARDMHLFKRWPLVGGAFSYELAIVRNFFTRRLGVEIELSLDGEDFKKVRCLFAVLANAPFYGGGYKGAPDAVPNDGELDFTKVDAISHFKVLRFLGKYKKGKFAQFPFCQKKRGFTMSFKSQKPIAVNLDGEIEECTSKTFSIKTAAMRFIIPSSLKLPEGFKKAQLLINV